MRSTSSTQTPAKQLPGANPHLPQNDAANKLRMFDNTGRCDFALVDPAGSVYECALSVAGNIVTVVCASAPASVNLGERLQNVLHDDLAAKLYTANSPLSVASRSSLLDGSATLWLQPKDQTRANERAATAMDTATKHLIFAALSNFSQEWSDLADTNAERPREPMSHSYRAALGLY